MQELSRDPHNQNDPQPKLQDLTTDLTIFPRALTGDRDLRGPPSLQRRWPPATRGRERTSPPFSLSSPPVDLTQPIWASGPRPISAVRSETFLPGPPDRNRFPREDKFPEKSRSLFAFPNPFHFFHRTAAARVFHQLTTKFRTCRYYGFR